MAIPAATAAELQEGGFGQFLRRLLGGASLLSLVSVLQQGIGFFLLPVYTRYLSPEDYGHIEVLMVSVFVALMIVGQGLPPSLLRALTYVLSGDPQRGRRAAGTALAYIGLSGVAVLLATVIVSRSLSGWLLGSPDRADLVIVGGVLVGLGAFISVASSVLFAAQRVGLAVGVGFGQFVVKLALNILFIVVLEIGFAGIIWSQLIGEAVGLLAVLWLLRGRVAWGLDVGELRPLLTYGMPLIGSTLGQQILMVTDRYVVGWLRPGAELGLYAVAHKFSTAFYFIVLTPLSRMWEVNSLDLVRDRRGGPRVARLASLFLLCGSIVVLVTQWLAEPLLAWILPPDFVAAEAAVGILVAGSVFHGLSEILKTGLRASGDSSRQALAAGVAALLNVGLTIFMVRNGGFVGAALATAVCLALYAGLTGLAAARSSFVVPWETGRLLLGSTVLLATCFAQPTLMSIDPSSRWALRGWLLLGYLALSPLLLDADTRGALAARLRPHLPRRLRPAEGDGHA